MDEEIDFKELMTKKSDNDLNIYLLNSKRYVPAAIYAAVDELKSRGRVFTDEELNAINGELQQKHEIEKQEDIKWTKYYPLLDVIGVVLLVLFVLSLFNKDALYASFRLVWFLLGVLLFYVRTKKQKK